MSEHVQTKNERAITCFYRMGRSGYFLPLPEEGMDVNHFIRRYPLIKTFRHTHYIVIMIYVLSQFSSQTFAGPSS